VSGADFAAQADVTPCHAAERRTLDARWTMPPRLMDSYDIALQWRPEDARPTATPVHRSFLGTKGAGPELKREGFPGGAGDRSRGEAA